MTLLVISAFSLSIALSLPLAPSPLFLGLYIIILALSISLFLSFSAASWLGLFIFLIYVGGLLVIFAYFVALTPNLLISGANIVILTTLSFLTLTLLINFIPISTNINISSTRKHNMFSLLLIVNSSSLIILALVLFIALVAVVKLCSYSSSPLRPFN